MLLEHAMFLLLLTALPVWDYFETRRLKSSQDPNARISSYWQTIGWEWATVLLLVLAVGPGGLFFQTDESLPWLPGPSNAIFIVVAAVVGLAVATLLILRDEEARDRMLQPLAFFRRRLATSGASSCSSA